MYHPYYCFTMTLRLFFTCFLVVLVVKYVYCNCGENSQNSAGIPPSSYPNPRRDETIQDTYANCAVIKDPYRWMENPDSPETKQFIQDEMAITTPYLEKSPYRAELQARYKELYNNPKYSTPFQKGNKFYSFQNTGLQNQNVLFVQDSITSEGKVFLDPNTFSQDGTVALSGISFSHDGLLFAYGISANGSDWKTIQFKHVEQGDIYNDKLTKVKFSGMSWTHDNKGIFYSAYLDQNGTMDGSENKANKNHKLYYHVLGTEQCKDVIVAEFLDYPDYLMYVSQPHKKFIKNSLDCNLC
ncbi:prolyl endopeptidase-like [Planococcus citri]|uniref:prolyl endopeptidase-like n=1 Tax=Planococcus citri TaxID=170843 RepID=UPI0031F9C10E